jgi:hypothetical protein
MALQVASASALGAYAGATGAAFLPYLCGSLEALDGAVRDPSPALRLAAVRALEFMLQPARGQPTEAVVGPAGLLVGALTRCLEVRLRILMGSISSSLGRPAASSCFTWWGRCVSAVE